MTNLEARLWRKTHRENCNRATRKYLAKNPEARIFKAMQKRCNQPSYPGYKYYGGRGIKVLLTSTKELISLIGKRPSDKHSIDRINNDGNYEAGNIRWATDSEQNKNRRRWVRPTGLKYKRKVS